MSNLGLGVMINILGGNAETVNAYQKAIGKTIKHVALSTVEPEWDGVSIDTLRLEFDDASTLNIFDSGQSCCESRYMRTDDKLEDFIGATLLNIELKEAPNMEDEDGDHEVQFLELMTSKGALTMASHNEHNGYYGGFAIKLKFQQEKQA
jgi:hypothetical protein